MNLLLNLIHEHTHADLLNSTDIATQLDYIFSNIFVFIVIINIFPDNYLTTWLTLNKFDGIFRYLVCSSTRKKFPVIVRRPRACMGVRFVRLSTRSKKQ